MKHGLPSPPDREGRLARARRIRLGLVLGPFVLGVLALVLMPLACASETSLSGPGEECFAATDCQDGLVCVPQRGGSRLCSDDLSQVAGRPPADGAAAAEAGEAGGDGPTEGAPPDGPVQDTSSVPDTSLPDTSTDLDAGADG